MSTQLTPDVIFETRDGRIVFHFRKEIYETVAHPEKVENMEILHSEVNKLSDTLYNFEGALEDAVDFKEDQLFELYQIPEMEGDFVSKTKGTYILWMPNIKRAALNSYEAGNWQWTDARSPQDALNRYHGVDGVYMQE